MDRPQRFRGRIRNTRQRVVVERIVLASDRPLTAQEVLALARESIPGLGIATVYRTLALMLTEGSITQVQLPKDPPRFELAINRERHYFRCRVCCRVFRVFGPAPEVEHMRPSGSIVDTHAIFLHGLCADCASS